MSSSTTKLVLGGLFGLLVFWGAAAWAGPIEAVMLFVGMAVVVGTAFVPVFWVRVLGCVYLGAVLLIMSRHAWGLGGAVVFAGVVVVLAWLYLPARVHRRIAFTIPSLVMLIFFTTILMYKAPGSPFASEKKADDAAIEQQMKQFRVAKTPRGFFAWYMQGLIVDGSMGYSVKVQGRTVNEVLLPALPVSMSLGLLALIFATSIGLGLGIRAGLKPNSVADYSSMGLAMVGISLPNFVIGAIFLIIFALNLGWLPVAGWGSYWNLLLPALTLALPYAAYIARLARGGTIEVMQQDFVRTARAKGLSEGEVVLKHAFKGAILPVVSFLGPAAAGILTGSFVVETLFGIPGMGQWFVNSAINRDYSVVLGTAIIYFTIVTLFNLLVDFAYAWLDPRVREDL